ncbi:hypothetical protein BDN71DRAFT_1434382 [Pleurotus eryngii]|uniref:Uncharacterized protein n=1 Tax=Pleurotus eryngii TaxID=5323 RepID=A0A9P5ZNV1_PLEER|nr:hypothetical protein BDN71DRAFT_1434382 [Pleurotus eryngii]
MTDTTKHFSLRVPFSTDGTPTVITLPWLGKADVPKSPQVKNEGRPSDEWAGLLPRAPPNLFRLSESLTPMPETPPPTPVVTTSQLRRSSRRRTPDSFASHSSIYGSGSTAGTLVSRANGNSKSNTLGGRSVTPAQTLATTLRGSAARKSRESNRYEPYPSTSTFKLLSHKIKNLDIYTRWFPISSPHPLRIPPISKKNERRLLVNDLCVNHLKGSSHVQTWIWAIDEKWVSISLGDPCVFDGVTRYLLLKAANVPTWVTRFVQKDEPVSVLPSSSTLPVEPTADFLVSDASRSLSTPDTDASAASLF